MAALWKLPEQTPSYSGYCLPTYRGPVLSLAARASGLGTQVLSKQLFLCAHGDSRSALAVVAAEGFWLITDSPVCNLLGRQLGMEKQPAPGTGHILPQHSNPKPEEINENPERESVSCPPGSAVTCPKCLSVTQKQRTWLSYCIAQQGKILLLPGVWVEPPLLPAPRASHCSKLTAQEVQPWPLLSAGSIWGSRALKPLLHPPPGEEAACQAASACQILLLPNCETAAFKETLFWPPATPQTAWYNFIIKEREKEKGLEERERGEQRKLLRPSQLVEYSAQRESGDSFPVGKLTPLIAHSVST